MLQKSTALLVIWVVRDKTTDPAGGCHQAAISSLLDMFEVLMNGAVSVSVHFHAAKVATNERQQTRKHPILQQ